MQMGWTHRLPRRGPRTQVSTLTIFIGATLFLAVLTGQLCAPSCSFATEGDIFKSAVWYGALTYDNHTRDTLAAFGPFGDPVDVNGATSAGGWRAEEALPDEYTILAPEDGRVDQVGFNTGLMGNAIVWSNVTGTERLFMAHLASVTKTGPVTFGEPIALIGGTAGPGNSFPPHLHISRQANGAAAPLVLSGAEVVPINVTPLPSQQHAVYLSQGPLPGVGPTPFLAGVDFVSDKVGWAVGFPGTILNTRDAGATWATQYHDDSEKWSFSAVDFVDKQRGCVVGFDEYTHKGIVLTTTDGGRHWTRSAVMEDRWLRSVRFVNPTTGWAVGRFGVIIKTTNGGRTWTSQKSGTYMDLTSVDFTNTKRGWAVGSEISYDPDSDTWDTGAVVVTTSDGGSTWRARDLGETYRPLAVDVLGNGVGWLAGYLPNGYGVIRKTTDGASTWGPLSNTAHNLNAVQFVDALSGWAVGLEGAVFRSADGGVSWTPQNSSTVNGLYSVSFPTASTGWAVGDGVIVRTTDGGSTWAVQSNVRLAPRVSNPVAPATMERGKPYSVTVSLEPRHAAGSTPVRVYRYRKVLGEWISYGYVLATAEDSETGSRCTASVTLPATGSWRLRAYAPADRSHSARWSSGYDYVSVATPVVWKAVTPPAKFVAYAKHAREHGMQAWYPGRLPSGFVLKSIDFQAKSGTAGWCDVVFAKGSKRVSFSMGPVSGADGDGPAPTGRTAWGSVEGDVFENGNWITWSPAGVDWYASLYGSGLTASEKRNAAKYMRKVP